MNADTSAEPQVSVIVPTYDEADNIAEAIDRLRDALAGLRHEIIVVDDDSPDGTWRIARDHSAGDPSIRVIRRLDDRGLSSAVLAGMAVAEGEALAVIDADGQHDESVLPEMVGAVLARGADVCVGSRSDESGGSYGRWTPLRRLVSLAASRTAKLVIPAARRITDPMTGYFVLSRDAYERVAPTINPRGFKILLEFIAKDGDLSIAEVGYRFKRRLRGESKLSGVVALNYLIAVLDLSFGRAVSPVFLMYCVVGLSGVVVSLTVFGIGELAGLPQIDTGLAAPFNPIRASAALGIQLSIISNFLANNYLTFHTDRLRGIRLVWGFCRFEAVSALGVLVHLSVSHTMRNSGFPISASNPELAAVVGNAVGLSLAGLVNFLLNITVTWSHRDRARRLTYG